MKETIQELHELKRKKNAIILAHIYQLPEIQDIADFVGDSLDLSKKTQQVDADIIVFCGVHFMAETASILNPNKKIILPELNAMCPMANMINAQKLKTIKSKYTNPIVVSYINTSADIKAESNICCTSSNAINVVKSIPKNKEIIFIPDRNLGAYVQKMSGIKMYLYDGFCPTHNNFILPNHILKLKKQYPLAKVLVHPECRLEVISLADKAMSTSQMCQYVSLSKHKEFIIGTETGILHRLQKENPQKKFYAASTLATCPNMKKITLEKILSVLINETNVIKISKTIRNKAYLPLAKMTEIMPCNIY
ncbi:MAG: quinolinate synthase NadA [Endomicrobium sp.]|jgi:quinolinate synthase|nr:quinolinate synthase NadA [Endomicrobium sp.]